MRDDNINDYMFMSNPSVELSKKFLKMELPDVMLKDPLKIEPSDTMLEDSTDGGTTIVYPDDGFVDSEYVTYYQSSVKVEPPDLMEKDPIDCNPIPLYSSYVRASLPREPTVNVKTSSFQKKKRVSGYILYSSNTRRIVASNHPHSSFGEVSRLVGIEWKKLSAHEKNMWEERAALVNGDVDLLAKTGPRKAIKPTSVPPKPSSSLQPYIQVWECLWDSCNYTFENQFDCLDHVLAEKSGHVCLWFENLPYRISGAFQCQWKNCPRIRRDSPPFPSLHRLIRHVREVHVLKNAKRIHLPDDHSQPVVNIENFIPSSRKFITNSVSVPVIDNHMNTSTEELILCDTLVPPFGCSGKSIISANPESDDCKMINIQSQMSFEEVQVVHPTEEIKPTVYVPPPQNSNNADSYMIEITSSEPANRREIVHVRSCEITESKKIDAKRKRRYLAYIHRPYNALPRSAKKCVQLAKKTIAQSNRNLQRLKLKHDRLRKRISSMKSFFEQLQKEDIISQNAKESMLVHLDKIIK